MIWPYLTMSYCSTICFWCSSSKSRQGAQTTFSSPARCRTVDCGIACIRTGYPRIRHVPGSIRLRSPVKSAPYPEGDFVRGHAAALGVFPDQERTAVRRMLRTSPYTPQENSSSATDAHQETRWSKNRHVARTESAYSAAVATNSGLKPYRS